MPEPNGSQPGLAPSNSTVASGAGGTVAIVVVWVVHQVYRVEIPPEVAVAIGGIAAFLLGYLPASGRR